MPHSYNVVKLDLHGLSSTRGKATSAEILQLSNKNFNISVVKLGRAVFLELED
jgi:hypothetical protein